MLRVVPAFVLLAALAIYALVESRVASETTVLAVAQAGGQAPAPEALATRVQRERQPYIDTLRDLVSIESGSRDLEGLTRLADLVASRLRALGGDVELVSPDPQVKFEDTPEQMGKAVLARFRGTGTKRVLLLAHMDTVYQRGMGAKQPFRVEGSRAYGLGIADDKQGVALIIHTMAILRSMNVRDYGLVTVLINADEEISAAGTRGLITRLGSEHDVVLSCESAGDEDSVTLATSGNGAIRLRVRGRASHAGSAPEQGRNALYELSHQILQLRDLSQPQVGLKMNWTLATAGSVRNMIPASAEATADVRVRRPSDWDVIERRVRERITKQLIPDTQVEVTVERRRPSLEPTPASRTLAEHAQRIYRETGRMLRVRSEGAGGATDAALAALATKAPVMEGLGILGFGAHSNDAEYVDLTSLEPRLFLLTRLIMDVSQGKP